MRIGVDFHVLEGIYQGSRRYLANLYWHISDIALDRHEFYFFVRDIHKISQEWHSKGRFVSYGGGSRVKRFFIDLPRVTRRYGVQLFHAQYIAPPFLPCPYVLTVHDILFVTHPQYFKLSDLIRLRSLTKKSVTRAAIIATVSEYSRQMILDHYDVEEDRVIVTPNGVDLSTFNAENREKSRRLISSRYGIEDFVLTVGRLEPRKNHVTLIRAYARLKGKYGEMPRLVIIGQKDFGYTKIYSEIIRLRLNKDVVILHDISDDMLPHFYRAAIFVVYPSHAEGFGLPVLEAMASGTPVIASNTTALPEVVGDSGLLVAPHSVDDLASKMEMLLFDRQLRDLLGAQGVSRAKAFTWVNSARRMLFAIEQLT